MLSDPPPHPTPQKNLCKLLSSIAYHYNINDLVSVLRYAPPPPTPHKRIPGYGPASDRDDPMETLVRLFQTILKSEATPSSQ